jgi:type I restriction enzyme, S subunit
VNATNLKKVLLPLPPVEYQQVILDEVRCIETAMNAAQIRNAELSKKQREILESELK